MAEQLQRLETRPERLWREFIEASRRAEKSHDIQDGFAAGRAWSRWLAEFVPDGSTKTAVHGQATNRQ
ncbi:hypothetical protein [Tardiphaga sp.]|uniref:hypothetical protein n=1 Tax=Tardiphaga sp. TaxID=1926292 RepID=UPI00262F75FC|nr:hypothetical protein [Tardiphaga sp.]MDB5619499.1 hypothetical protein [Tardiphaga sp.]